MAGVAPPLCGIHQAFVYEMGGQVVVGEIEKISVVRWNRIRDEISLGYVRVPAGACCTLLTDTETVKHELHIYRSGEMVWCGVITRLEFEWDGVNVFAEDMLWPAKRRAVSEGYNYQYPPSGSGPISALDLADSLLIDQCYGRNGDPWKMLGHINRIDGPTIPGCQRQTNSWASSVWEELDALGEDYGIDYTVVGRDIFYFDVHLAWIDLPDLLDIHLSESPRIVEYGNSFATRYIKTNGSGYAAAANAPSIVIDAYAADIDFIASEDAQAERVDDGAGEPEVPTPAELAAWVRTAESKITEYYPPRQSIVIPANSTLMPASPWDVNVLVPGSWFMVYVERECRIINEYHRLHEVSVEEIGGQSESVRITTASAPSAREEPIA